MTSIASLLTGIGLAGWLEHLCRQERTLLDLPQRPATFRWSRGTVVVLTTSLLFLLLYWVSFPLNGLDTAEVQPSPMGRQWRFVFHLILISLLIVATAIDFDCYMIPDSITLPGTLIGLLAATVIGELQISHLWVDWSIALPQLRGPYIPSWYDAHRHWHGFAWSCAGLITGASLTWCARLTSSKVLGQEAMGYGDVTLMAMIGSFLGWQGVTMVFLIAPILGLGIGLIIRTLSGKTYLPYGPWLSMAAVTVLLLWGPLWKETRLIFSDWLSIGVLGAVGSIGFVALLALIQLYKSIPTRSRSTTS